MPTTADLLAAVGVQVPDVLIPAQNVDLYRWAVVACDQYTSQPDYWQDVEGLVAQEPSTLRLTLPEVYLDDPDVAERISGINAAMRQYLADGVFSTRAQTLILVRRETTHSTTRWGLMVALDLDAYSWALDSRSLIRATEGTILDRLPPRVKVRQDAAVELPHILVLLDDERRSVIEPLTRKVSALEQVYDTDLMLGGGHVTGWAVSEDEDLAAVADALTDVAAGLDPSNPLLFAMGDGNHSFATAKSIWESIKPTLSDAERATHPARYCLVELVNIYDEGLTFEAIHRVLFDLPRESFEGELEKHCGSYEFTELDGLAALNREMLADSAGQRFGYCDASGFGVYTLTDPAGTIPAATVQAVIDALVDDRVCTVDYIHGDGVTARLGQSDGNCGIFLPAVAKSSFFTAILTDGALPRKTFSMGEADEKRFYLEARRISTS